MPPDEEETEQPKDDSPTETSNPSAPVTPADPPDGQEVVQDQVTTETHVEERAVSDDEDEVAENKGDDSEE